jgi:hypothetical protein
MSGDNQKEILSHDEIVKGSKMDERTAADLSRQIQSDMRSAVCGTPEAKDKANQDLQNIAKTLNAQNDNGMSGMLVNEQLRKNGFPDIQIVNYGKPGATDTHITDTFQNANGSTTYSWDAAGQQVSSGQSVAGAESKAHNK